MGYERPTVVDHGDLTELTAASQTFGCEDGGDKFTDPNHHSPVTGPCP